jgi:hypothetical protein
MLFSPLLEGDRKGDLDALFDTDIEVLPRGDADEDKQRDEEGEPLPSTLDDRDLSGEREETGDRDEDDEVHTLLLMETDPDRVDETDDRIARLDVGEPLSVDSIGPLALTNPVDDSFGDADNVCSELALGINGVSLAEVDGERFGDEVEETITDTVPERVAMGEEDEGFVIEANDVGELDNV